MPKKSAVVAAYEAAEQESKVGRSRSIKVSLDEAYAIVASAATARVTVSTELFGSVNVPKGKALTKLRELKDDAARFEERYAERTWNGKVQVSLYIGEAYVARAPGSG